MFSQENLGSFEETESGWQLRTMKVTPLLLAYSALQYGWWMTDGMCGDVAFLFTEEKDPGDGAFKFW